MEKLTEKLRYVLEDCIDCISPIQQEVINKAVDRLAAYEKTGMDPEDFKRAFNEAAVLKLAGQALGITPDRLHELAQADRGGAVRGVAVQNWRYSISYSKMQRFFKGFGWDSLR